MNSYQALSGDEVRLSKSRTGKLVGSFVNIPISVAIVIATGMIFVRFIVAVVTKVNLSFLRREVGQEFRNRAIALHQAVHQVLGETFITVAEEGCGETCVTHATGATNPMHILCDSTVLGVWEITIDDVTDVRHVPASRRKSRRDENWAPARSECGAVAVSHAVFAEHHLANLLCILALSLISFSMDGSDRQSSVIQVVVKQIHRSFGVAEYQRSGPFHGLEEVVDCFVLAKVIDLDNVLPDVHVGLTWATDTNAVMVFSHVLTCQRTSLLWESGREHHEYVIRILICI
jgi:hypothetical protein